MILVTAFLDLLAMGIVMPVLPTLVEELTGSVVDAGFWIGVIGSLWAVAQFIAAPIVGALSDRFGRRPVILVSAGGLALDWVVMALAPTLWWLIVGRLIGGVTSASVSAVFAYMADVTRPEERTRAFGLIGAVVSAGMVGGPALGGLLGQFGPRVPFWVAAALSALAWLYGLFVLKESLPSEGRKPFAWRTAHPLDAVRLISMHRDLGSLAGCFFLLVFSHRIFTTVFVLYAGYRYGLSTLEIGALLTLSGVLDLFVQGLLLGPAIQRFGDKRVMVFGLLVGAACLLGMGLAPTPPEF